MKLSKNFGKLKSAKPLNKMNIDEIKHLIEWAMNEQGEYQKLINQLLAELKKRYETHN